MRVAPQLLLTAGISLIASFSVCGPAQAYVDPNAGGLLFQLLAPIIALAAAGAAFARRQLLRLWDLMLLSMKAFAARIFRG
jgi:hypothetical protein